MKKLLSIVLASALIFSCILPAFADGRVANDDEKEYYTQLFNAGVNSVKTEMPKATVTFNNYVPEGGITAGGTGPVDEIDDKAQQFLTPVLEGLFNNRSSLAKSFVKTLFDDESSTVESVELHKGTLRNKLLPLYGEKYMSSLTPADDYDIAVYEDEGASYPTSLIVSFPEMTLEQAKEGSVSKVFSLPSGSLDLAILGGERTELTSRLDNAQLQNFNIKNANVITRFDENGNLTYYGSWVDYSFSISFYDSMNLIAAVLGYNVYTAVINAIGTIMSNIGRDDISPDDILKDRQIYITYRRTVEITNMDYRDRLFGDIDNDNTVSVADARMALRHAVELELITSSNDQIYADVNFDGSISTVDARLILRMAVELDETFSEVPEGKSIKIVKIEEEIADPDEPDEGEKDKGGTSSGGIVGIFDNFNPDATLEDIANAILEIIGLTGDVEGSVENSIADWIDVIKALIEAARGNNP